MSFVICGNYGVGNIGDEAIREGLILFLQKISPGAEVKVMGNGSLFPFGIRSAFKSLVLWDLWKKPVRLVRECDVFILGGGGLFTDEEGPFVSTLWLLHGLAAVFMKKPVFCLGISVGRLWPWNVWLLKKLFKRAGVIVMRDEASQQKILAIGIQAILGTDFALNLPKQDFSTNKDKKYVVIALRNYKKNDSSLYTKIAQLCDLISSKFASDIILLPMQPGEHFDDTVLSKIFELTKNKNAVHIAKNLDNINDVRQILGHAQLVIATPLHAGILAASCGTPVIPLSYMEKVNDFWKEFPEVRRFNAMQLDLDGLLQEVDSVLNHLREKRSLVQNIQQKLKNRLSKSEKILSESLKSLLKSN